MERYLTLWDKNRVTISEMPSRGGNLTTIDADSARIIFGFIPNVGEERKIRITVARKSPPQED